MEGTNPVNKKLVAALSGGAVLVLALSGCSDDGGEVDAYAKKVCDDVQPQLKKITQANQAIKDSAADDKPQNVKKTDSAAFQQISDAYAALSDSVEKAGTPPVDNGAQIQKDAVKELDATSKAYAELKQQTDKLNTKTRGTFADGLKKLIVDIERVNEVGNAAIRKLQSGEIGTAMAKQTSCQRTTKAPSAAS